MTPESTRTHVHALCDGSTVVLACLDELLSHLVAIPQIERILDAIVFAAEKHRHQKRKDWTSTPYVAHPIQVTSILLTIGRVNDPDILIAALLHDTVEDTETTLAEVSQRYGERVAGFVGEMTDDAKLPWRERKRLQIENAHMMTPEAAMIKLADKYCNLTDLMRQRPKAWTAMRADDYFEWATQVIHRLPAANPALKEAVEAVIAKYWAFKESS